MSKSYDDYENEYQSYLGRIRSFLASARSRSTLLECQNLIHQAKQCATAMQAMAQVEGNAFHIHEAQQLLSRDIMPLQMEIQHSLEGGGGGTRGRGTGTGTGATFHQQNQPHEDLFYRPPTQHNLSTEALLESSNDLLRESQALVADSEAIGMSTLTQMSMQREQLQIASDNMNDTVNLTAQARRILKDMRHKVFKNKMALYTMIVILLFLNGLVIRAIWKKHHPRHY